MAMLVYVSLSEGKSLSRSLSFLEEILTPFACRFSVGKFQPLRTDTLQDTLGRVSKRRQESSRKAKRDGGNGPKIQI